jgi:hypothetical protein
MTSEDEQSVASNDMYEDECDGLDNYYKNAINKGEKENKISSKEFVYSGLNLLNSDNLDECANEFNEVNINCCTFQINTTGQQPFLQFVLRKQTKPDLLTFPSFKRKTHESVLDMCDLIQEVVCASYCLKPNNYEYKGFINDGSTFYIFYELNKNSIDVHDLCRRSDLWLVLMDEIINHKSCCNFPIDESVSQFFTNYINLACLKDTHDNYIETPIVGYTGVKNKEINLTSVFGVTKKLEPHLNKEYFYFTDYRNAIRMGGWTEDKVKMGGIIRFALFLGNMKWTINDCGLDEENCDSIYIGDTQKSPLWALKDYVQQLPLTCHCIEKSNLGESWDKDRDYYIY